MDRDLLHFLKMDNNGITLWDLGPFILKSILYNPFELFAPKTKNSYTPKVSVQGVVALGGHFATLCLEVDFYEAFFFFITY